jgi:hypothetical protein
MQGSGKLYAPLSLPHGKFPCYTLDRRLGGLHSRSGRNGREISVYIGNRTPVLLWVAYSLQSLSYPWLCPSIAPLSSWISLCDNSLRMYTEFDHIFEILNSYLIYILKLKLQIYCDILSKGTCSKPQESIFKSTSPKVNFIPYSLNQFSNFEIHIA